jgi:cysteine sulfinate desulfinase/cysteine desulfurase-like protein
MTDAKPVYPDYNATTPLDPDVIAHIPARAVVEARARVAELLRSAAEEVVFTSRIEHPAVTEVCRGLAERGFG